MGELVDEMRRLNEGPASEGGLVDEMRRLNSPNPEMAPEVPVGPSGTARWGQNPVGWTAALYNHFRENPDQAIELAVQFATTGMGMAAGVAGGPPGIAAGGAAGNVAGRGVAHDINRALGLVPDTGPADILSDRSLADAAVGAVGGVLQPAARSMMGLSRSSQQMASRARDAGVALELNPPSVTRTAGLPPGPHRVRSAEGGDDLLQINLPEHRTLGQLAARTGEWGALATALMSGNLTAAAALLVGGHGVRAGLSAATERLFQEPRFLAFILRNSTPGARISREELGVAMGALASESWLTADQRVAIRQLQRGMGVNPVSADRERLSNPERHADARNPFGRSVEVTEWGTRDITTGRFTSGD